MVPWFKENLGQWVDFTLTQMPFQSNEWASGGEWARLLVSALVWVAIPLGLGVVRVMRSEIK